MKINVISVEIMHPGNLGAIARLCHNFDINKLILVNPQCEINKEAYDRATHGKDYLDGAIILDTFSEIRTYNDVIVGLSARKGGQKNLTRSPLPIQEIPNQISDVKGSIGFVLGRENFGLYNDEVSECDLLSYIHLPGENDVLNISHALSVALWEFIRAKDFEEPVDHRIMTGDEKRAFLNFLEKILEFTRMDEQQYYAVIKVYQSILSRALVTEREANTLIGTLRTILIKLENPNKVWD